jgi:hypothetical protein
MNRGSIGAPKMATVDSGSLGGLVSGRTTSVAPHWAALGTCHVHSNDKQAAGTPQAATTAFNSDTLLCITHCLIS